MPDVSFIHPGHGSVLNRWRLVRDVCKGSETIKAARQRYLPRPNDVDKSLENEARYIAYLKRAVFFNATGHTRNSLVGAVFRVVPGLVTPDALSYVSTDIDGQGVSIYQQSQSVIGHLLEVGRHGLLVDFPQMDGQAVSLADMQSGRVRATVSSYEAESIINWKTRKVGGQHLLSLVVLREMVDMDGDDGFSMEQVEQFRVLRLGDDGIYTQEVWGADGLNIAAFAPLDGTGRPWNIIPFQFLGSENNDSSIDDSPLYDMAEVNLGHYRNSADYEEAAYLVGQPQPWMSGLDEQWRDHLERNGIFLGARSPWLLPVGGACGMMQAQPNTVAKEAMEAKENQLVSLGARLTERGSAIKTATQEINDSAAEHSVLSLIVSNVGEAYTQCLKWMGVFTNATGDALYKPSQDFSQVTLDATVLVGLFNAVQGGKLPESVFWSYLRDRGVIDSEKTDDELRDELQTSAPPLNLDEEVEPDVSEPSVA